MQIYPSFLSLTSQAIFRTKLSVEKNFAVFEKKNISQFFLQILTEAGDTDGIVDNQSRRILVVG